MSDTRGRGRGIPSVPAHGRGYRPEIFNEGQRDALNEAANGIVNVAVSIATEPIISEFGLILGNEYGDQNLRHETYIFKFGSFGWNEKLLVKIAKKDAEGDNKLARNEFEMLSLLNREANVERLVYVGSTKTDYYIAVFRAGYNLTECFKKKLPIFEPGLLATYYKQMLEGLDALHKYGICHRDISFANVYVSGSQKVCFGGLKHATRGGETEISSADIPLDRLVWTYHDYGAGKYGYKTELFLVACVMNSIVNRNFHSCNYLNLENAANGIYTAEEALAVYCESWQQRSAIILNKVLMSKIISHEKTLLLDSSILQEFYLFWDLSKSFNFVITCYDYLDGYRSKSLRARTLVAQEHYRKLVGRLKRSLNCGSQHLFPEEGWLRCIRNIHLISILENPGFRDGTVYSLLQTIRNRAAHHYEDIPEVQDFFKALPEEYIAAWLEMFPSLVAHLARWVLRNNLQFDHGSFARYFRSATLWTTVREIQLESIFEPMLPPLSDFQSEERGSSTDLSEHSDDNDGDGDDGNGGDGDDGNGGDGDDGNGDGGDGGDGGSSKKSSKGSSKKSSKLSPKKLGETRQIFRAHRK